MLGRHRSPEDRETHSEYLRVYGPGVVLALAALFVTYQFVDPAPPSRIVIEIADITDLAGKHVDIGPVGSGTRSIGLELLADNGLSDTDLEISELGGEAAWDVLEAGQLDALLVVSAVTSGHVQHALRVPGIRLLDFVRADAYTRLHHFLSKLVLPQGVADLRRNLPRRDTTLLAPTANLLAAESLHPALVELLLEAATEVNGPGGMFEAAHEFPSRRYLDFPLHEEARRYFQSGPSFLKRTLPYWATNLVERLAVMLVALIALVFPLVRIMPPTYRWRVRRRVYRWYKELRALEREMREVVEPLQLGGLALRLDDIEAGVREVSIPWSYADELYQLRVHIQFLRDTLIPASGSLGDSQEKVYGSR